MRLSVNYSLHVPRIRCDDAVWGKLLVIVICNSNWYRLRSAELEGDADEDQIKFAYRRLAKFYHPDG